MSKIDPKVVWKVLFGSFEIGDLVLTKNRPPPYCYGKTTEQVVGKKGNKILVLQVNQGEYTSCSGWTWYFSKDVKHLE